MGRASAHDIDLQLTRLATLLRQAGEDGLTIHEMTAAMGLPKQTVRGRIRRMRRVLADYDANVVAESDGYRQPWRYRLVGNVDDARWWTRNRLRDAETRLATVEATTNSIVNATSPADPDGQRARKIYRTIAYLRSELADIDNGVAAP